MKFRATIFLPLCLTLSAWSQLTFTVPVVDKSDSGSPLEISGTASFIEEVVGNSVTAFSEYEGMPRNMSGKEVVLLVAYFDEAGGNGGSSHQVLRIDHSFRHDFSPRGSCAFSRD